MRSDFDIDDFAAQLEKEKSWRQLEIRALESIYTNYKEALENSEINKNVSERVIHSQKIQRDVCLKSLFVMLHAHIEGFFKTVIEFYALEINSYKILCKDANEFLGAATLLQVFVDIEQGINKDPLFKGSDLPADNILHKTYRRVAVVRDLNNLHLRNVNIPIDSLVGRKAKFTSDDAQRVLYLAGFDHQAIKNREDSIKRLAAIRNSIAHGDKEGKIKENLLIQYEKMREDIFQTMDDLIKLVADALREERYKAISSTLDT